MANDIDILAYFARVAAAGRAGVAQKTRAVDVRDARLDEVVVTIIKGEGKETQSKPAKPGDKVVRNRCEATGNEEILVSAATFAKRYRGPLGKATADGWSTYRPRGVRMRFVVVTERDGSFTFTAPWGEPMVARPRDYIVQDPRRPKDTYRIARAAFECTYTIMKRPPR